MERAIQSAKYFKQFAAAPVTNANIAAFVNKEADVFCTGLELIAGGTVTLTLLDGTSQTLGPLPAGWVRAIQFKAITASDSTMILYRSTTEGIS